MEGMEDSRKGKKARVAGEQRCGRVWILNRDNEKVGQTLGSSGQATGTRGPDYGSCPQD